MVRISAFIRLGMSPTLLKEVQAEAKFQGIGVNELIRTALQAHLRHLDKRRVEDAYRENRPVKTRPKTV